MNKIRHLLDVVDQVRDHVALGLMSDPGLSKTSQVKQWAEENGREYCELIISQRMPSEISGMPMPVNETHHMEIYDFETLLHLKDGDVLAFDEFTNGNIQTLNACLTLIQERVMLSGKPLPSLVIVAMGNPQGRCDLLPQTKQRFWWVDVAWDPDTWMNYMTKEWGFTPNSKLLEVIGNQYRLGFGDSGNYNYMTPRTVENLIRIALKIPQTDPFWAQSCVDADLVEALYLSITKGKDVFREQQRIILEWLEARKHEYDWAGAAILNIGLCNTRLELRKYLASLESDGLAPELFYFLQSADPVDE